MSPSQEPTCHSRCSLSYSHELFLVELGKKLRQMRINRGWSLRDMIAKHGFHLAHWQGFEKGKGVSVRSLLRLCDVFNVSLEDLIAGLGRSSSSDPSDSSAPETLPTTKQATKKNTKAKTVRSAS